MTDKELKDKIGAGVKSAESLLTLRETIVSFARSGGRAGQAISVLTDLRLHTKDAQVDERLLELLDLATGYCVPALKIW